MLGLFKKKIVYAQERVIEPEGVINPKSDVVGVNIGAWVTTPDGPGVYLGDSLVAIAKADGTNKMMLDENDKAVQVIVEFTPTQLAFIEDIPDSRVPDKGLAYRMGYKHKDAQ